MRMLSAVALGACIVATACSDTQVGTFRGVYVSAFETSGFRRCGSRESWWLTDATGSLHAQLPPPEAPAYAQSAYLEIQARVSKRGHYGHLGASPREITVLEVLSLSPDTANKCQSLSLSERRWR